jgi:hypothetical protein
VVTTPQCVRRAYERTVPCLRTRTHFFLPPEIFALIASASAFCFFICSFWAKEPSSSSSSSSFLPLAATSSKPGQQAGSESGGAVRSGSWRPFLLTTFFCDLLLPSPAPLIGCEGNTGRERARVGGTGGLWRDHGAWRLERVRGVGVADSSP